MSQIHQTIGEAVKRSLDESRDVIKKAAEKGQISSKWFSGCFFFSSHNARLLPCRCCRRDNKSPIQHITRKKKSVYKNMNSILIAMLSKASLEDSDFNEPSSQAYSKYRHQLHLALHRLLHRVVSLLWGRNLCFILRLLDSSLFQRLFLLSSPLCGAFLHFYFSYHLLKRQT